MSVVELFADVRGAGEPVVLAHAIGAQALARGIPEARPAVIANAAHRSSVERPEAFGPLVRDFLRAENT